MKNSFVSLFILSLIFSACKPDAYKEIGIPSNKLESISGSWKLIQVTQTDLIAQNNGYQDPSRPDISLITLDITNTVPFTDFRMVLNVAASGPTTFTTTSGNAPKIIQFPTGNWVVDNVTNPTYLNFKNGADTLRMDIGNYSSLNLNNVLTLSRTKFQGSKPVIRYEYKFTKQN